MKPERALFYDENAPHLLDAENYDRLYVGAEFCPWRFPNMAKLEEAFAAARKRSLPLTLVTPILAEKFLPQLQATLRTFLPHFSDSDEVVISDWGGLPLIRALSPMIPVLMGRVLSAQKRGAQILELDLSPQQLAYFRQSAWSSQATRDLLAEAGITRIELDLPPQGLAPLPAELFGTLHTPYSLVTSSRNCPFRTGSPDRGCPVQCGEIFTLLAPHSPLPLWQDGNTQHYRIDKIPHDLSSLGIDRIVFHPRLPR